MVAQGIGGADTMNSLAWLLATCPDERVRDGAKAVRLSEQALRPDPNNANKLDTLAAALAAAGRFRDAVSTQEKAARLTTDDARPRYLERVELYRANKPYVGSLSGSRDSNL